MALQTKFKRLFDLHRRFLSHARLTVPRIMEDYGVNRRTVNRDLNDLIDMGVPLESRTLPNGQKSWQLPASGRKISVPFNLTDLAALFMGRRLFDFSKGTLLEDSLDKIYTSIENQVTREKDFVKISQLKKKVHIVNEGPKHLKQEHIEELDEILTGLLENRKLDFNYKDSRGRRASFSVAPYTLVTYKRGLYLLASLDNTQQPETRIFAVERITDAEARRGTSYKLPSDFDPETYFKDALFIQRGLPAHVELAFNKSSAPFIKMRQFHHSQRITSMKDGRLKMTLEVPSGEGDFEIVNWILSFHEYVEVLSPDSLKKKVKNHLRNALKHYS